MKKIFCVITLMLLSVFCHAGLTSLMVGPNGNVVNTNNSITFTNIINGNGIIANSALSSNVATNVILPNGTNDMSIIFQNAMNSNSWISLVPAVYYVTNLFMGSNVRIEGNGATIKQLYSPSQLGFATNQYWSEASTNLNAIITMIWGCHNQSINNVTFDGGCVSNYQAFNLTLYSGNTFTFQVTSLMNGQGSNNWGLSFNQSAGGEVSGCRFINFSGGGAFIASSVDQLGYTGPKTFFDHNETATNFIGVFVNQWGGNHPTTGGNAEYSQLDHLAVHDNAIGVSQGASNGQLDDSTINFNRVGIVVSGGNGNSGPHTKYQNLNLNHNYCGMWIGAIDFFAFENCYETAVTTNYIHNSSFLRFDNCDIENLWIANEDGQNTNRITQFYGGHVFNAHISTNNVDFEGVNLVGINFCNANVYCYNCNAYGFTNWTMDIVTNLGNTGFYTGNNNHNIYGLSVDNGNFVGDASQLKTFNSFGQTLILSNIFNYPSNFVNTVSQTNCPFLTFSNVPAGAYAATLHVFKYWSDTAGGVEAGLSFTPNVTNYTVIDSYMASQVDGFLRTQPEQHDSTGLNIPNYVAGAGSQWGSIDENFGFICTNTTTIAVVFSVTANTNGVIRTAWITLRKQ